VKPVVLIVMTLVVVGAMVAYLPLKEVDDGGGGTGTGFDGDVKTDGTPIVGALLRVCRWLKRSVIDTYTEKQEG